MWKILWKFNFRLIWKIWLNKMVWNLKTGWLFFQMQDRFEGNFVLIWEWNCLQNVIQKLIIVDKTFRQHLSNVKCHFASISYSCSHFKNIFISNIIGSVLIWTTILINNHIFLPPIPECVKLLANASSRCGVIRISSTNGRVCTKHKPNTVIISTY